MKIQDYLPRPFWKKCNVSTHLLLSVAQKHGKNLNSKPTNLDQTCPFSFNNIALIHRFLNFIVLNFFIYFLQVSSLANWLNFLPTSVIILSRHTTRLKNLQANIASFQHSTVGIISISISTIQISFITSSDHCGFCSGRCI